jgi:hypothetical protein
MTSNRTITINRAPVLTLWAAVVAERLGYDREASLTLGKALAGLNAQAKGRRIGIFQTPPHPPGKPPRKTGLGEDFWIDLCGRGIPAKKTPEGIRAVILDKAIEPAQVDAYLERAFGENLSDARKAMEELARAFTPAQLADSAFTLYEHFRPSVATGQKGWGQKGELSLEKIRKLASRG